MLRKTGLIIAPILLVLIASSDLFAEKAPESKDEADHAVTALVESVYTRTVTLDAGTAFETRQIEYVIELDVQEVQRGEEAKVGKRFYVHCFKRDDSALTPGATPPPGASGHRKIPKEGQIIKAYTRYAHKMHNGLYPQWFDLVKDVEGKK